jgi:hypothetical protein
MIYKIDESPRISRALEDDHAGFAKACPSTLVKS